MYAGGPAPGRPPRHSPWQWHRLLPEWADRIADDARVEQGDLVLDLGAGTGTLTRALLDRGARVVAVELHAGRAAKLRRRFGNDVRVVEQDLLTMPLPRRPFAVVANPPFGLTTPLLLRLLDRGSALRRADLVLQRAAARRWAEQGGRNARRFEITVPWLLPRSAFSPRPQVDAAILRVRRR